MPFWEAFQNAILAGYKSEAKKEPKISGDSEVKADQKTVTAPLVMYEAIEVLDQLSAPFFQPFPRDGFGLKTPVKHTLMQHQVLDFPLPVLEIIFAYMAIIEESGEFVPLVEASEEDGEGYPRWNNGFAMGDVYRLMPFADISEYDVHSLRESKCVTLEPTDEKRVKQKSGIPVNRFVEKKGVDQAVMALGKETLRRTVWKMLLEAQYDLIACLGLTYYARALAADLNKVVPEVLLKSMLTKVGISTELFPQVIAKKKNEVLALRIEAAVEMEPLAVAIAFGNREAVLRLMAMGSNINKKYDFLKYKPGGFDYLYISPLRAAWTFKYLDVFRSIITAPEYILNKEDLLIILDEISGGVYGISTILRDLEYSKLVLSALSKIISIDELFIDKSNFFDHYLSLATYKESGEQGIALLQTWQVSFGTMNFGKLMYKAVCEGNLKVIQHLIKMYPKMLNDKEAIAASVRKGCEGIVSIFAEAGADLNAPFSREANFHEQGNGYATIDQPLLHIASTSFDGYMVKHLLLKGVRPDHENTFHHTALNVAASMGPDESNTLNIGIVALLDAGANPFHKGKYGETAREQLEGKSYGRHGDVLDPLIQLLKIAESDYGSKEINPLLHSVVAANDVTLLERTIKGFLNLDQLDTKGNTALHCAAMNGDEDTLSCLLQAGASLQVTDAKGRLPLAVAKTDACRHLLDQAMGVCLSSVSSSLFAVGAPIGVEIYVSSPKLEGQNYIHSRLGG